MATPFDRFISGTLNREVTIREPARVQPPLPPPPLSESSSEDELSVEEIIREKPAVKIVREFFRDILAGIKSDEEKLFSA